MLQNSKAPMQTTVTRVKYGISSAFNAGAQPHESTASLQVQQSDFPEGVYYNNCLTAIQ